MAVYMIAYDLHEGEDYDDLIKAIKALPSSSASKWRSKSTIH